MEAVARLKTDVEVLALEIGERHIWRRTALAAAADYIERQLRASGYEISRQTYAVDGVRISNLEATLPGDGRPDEVLLIGAHYDTIEGSPGANDNGTGIAATLELARRFAGRAQRRTLRFVAFVNEEPPYFHTARMGSLVYATAARDRGDRIAGMLAMETIGYYSEEKGSQRYPAPFDTIFPDVGNFIAVVGNPESASFVDRIRTAFQAGSTFPITASALPPELPGVGWSDHWSFWECGYPAVMVTDTAPFRYPWYHTRQDTPDKIAFDKVAAVVDGFEHVVRTLADAD